MEIDENKCWNRYKKKLIVSRQSTFINLKSNTMKNTIQNYKFYVIQHNFSARIFSILTLFKC